MLKGRLAELFSREHIIQVLRNPRAFPQEALVLAGVVVIIVLIVLALLALIFARPAPGKRRVKKRRRTPLVALGFLLGFGIFVSLIIGSFSVVVTQSRFCNLCHQMKKSYSSWKTSSHAKTDCISCHQKPGLFGFATYELERIGDVRIYLSRKSNEPVRVDVDSETCLKCHEEQVGKTFVARSIRVRHKDFLDAGQRCTLCHNTAGHGREVTNPKYPSMSPCTQCHNGKKVSADCQVCHSKDVGAVATRQGERVLYPTVEIGPPTTCRGCHSVESCNKCHGLELPHPTGWVDQITHASPAAFEKKESCLKCHSLFTCNRCHKFPGHDPTTWKRDHALAQNDTGCRSCHASPVPSFCGLCHPGR